MSRNAKDARTQDAPEDLSQFLRRHWGTGVTEHIASFIRGRLRVTPDVVYTVGDLISVQRGMDVYITDAQMEADCTEECLRRLAACIHVFDIYIPVSKVRSGMRKTGYQQILNDINIIGCSPPPGYSSDLRLRVIMHLFADYLAALVPSFSKKILRQLGEPRFTWADVDGLLDNTVGVAPDDGRIYLYFLDLIRRYAQVVMPRILPSTPKSVVNYAGMDDDDDDDDAGDNATVNDGCRCTCSH